MIVVFVKKYKSAIQHNAFAKEPWATTTTTQSLNKLSSSRLSFITSDWHLITEVYYQAQRDRKAYGSVYISDETILCNMASYFLRPWIYLNLTSSVVLVIAIKKVLCTSYSEKAVYLKRALLDIKALVLILNIICILCLVL